MPFGNFDITYVEPAAPAAPVTTYSFEYDPSVPLSTSTNTFLIKTQLVLEMLFNSDLG